MFNYPGEPHSGYAMDNPPIVRVVVQIAYFPSARLATPDALAEIQEHLPSGFQLQQQPALGFHISVGGMGGVLPGANATFVHPDGFELTVNPESLVLAIDQRYRDRSAFAAVLEPVMTIVGAAGRIRDYLRMGVRYINAAPATVRQFCTWFKREYVGWGGAEFVADDSDRTWVLITQISRTDPTSPVTHGVIRYGFLQNGVGVDITRSEAATSAAFIADIDMGDQRPGPFEPPTISQKFRTINHEIARFFEHSMTPEGIAHFAVRAREE